MVELFRDYMSFLSPREHEEILSRTVQRVWHFVLRNASAMDRRQVTTTEKIE